jgi:hypothetical protein
MLRQITQISADIAAAAKAGNFVLVDKLKTESEYSPLCMGIALRLLVASQDQLVIKSLLSDDYAHAVSFESSEEANVVQEFLCVYPLIFNRYIKRIEGSIAINTCLWFLLSSSEFPFTEAAVTALLARAETITLPIESPELITKFSQAMPRAHLREEALLQLAVAQKWMHFPLFLVGKEKISGTLRTAQGNTLFDLVAKCSPFVVEQFGLHDFILPRISARNDPIVVNAIQKELVPSEVGKTLSEEDSLSQMVDLAKRNKIEDFAKLLSSQSVLSIPRLVGLVLLQLAEENFTDAFGTVLNLDNHFELEEGEAKRLGIKIFKSEWIRRPQNSDSFLLKLPVLASPVIVSSFCLCLAQYKYWPTLMLLLKNTNGEHFPLLEELLLFLVNESQFDILQFIASKWSKEKETIILSLAKAMQANKLSEVMGFLYKHSVGDLFVDPVFFTKICLRVTSRQLMHLLNSMESMVQKERIPFVVSDMFTEVDLEGNSLLHRLAAEKNERWDVVKCFMTLCHLGSDDEIKTALQVARKSDQKIPIRLAEENGSIDLAATMLLKLGDLNIKFGAHQRSYFHLLADNRIPALEAKSLIIASFGCHAFKWEGFFTVRSLKETSAYDEADEARKKEIAEICSSMSRNSEHVQELVAHAHKEKRYDHLFLFRPCNIFTEIIYHLILCRAWEAVKKCSQLSPCRFFNPRDGVTPAILLLRYPEASSILLDIIPVDQSIPKNSRLPGISGNTHESEGIAFMYSENSYEMLHAAAAKNIDAARIIVSRYKNSWASIIKLENEAIWNPQWNLLPEVEKAKCYFEVQNIIIEFRNRLSATSGFDQNHLCEFDSWAKVQDMISLESYFRTQYHGNIDREPPNHAVSDLRQSIVRDMLIKLVDLRYTMTMKSMNLRVESASRSSSTSPAIDAAASSSSSSSSVRKKM